MFMYLIKPTFPSEICNLQLNTGCFLNLNTIVPWKLDEACSLVVSTYQLGNLHWKDKWALLLVLNPN